jgi:hypothetical protein
MRSDLPGEVRAGYRERLVMPDGGSIVVLERKPAADPEGFIGLEDSIGAGSSWGPAIHRDRALDGDRNRYPLEFTTYRTRFARVSVKASISKPWRAVSIDLPARLETQPIATS